jgi:hypothetical protein
MIYVEADRQLQATEFLYALYTNMIAFIPPKGKTKRINSCQLIRCMRADVDRIDKPPQCDIYVMWSLDELRAHVVQVHDHDQK